MSTNNEIYFDYAATTPLDPEVEEALLPYLKDKFGNPGSLHKFGQEAITGLDKARENIAEKLGCAFTEIIFTGSATEASNLAIRGTIKRALESGIKNPKIITSEIEHPSVENTISDLEGEVETVRLPVDNSGFIDPADLKETLNKNTVLVSIMYANNEIGTVEPISEISKIIDDFKKSNVNSQQSNVATVYPLLHTDAVQAFQYFGCDVRELGVDLMTLSAHKIYGPKGIGLLYIKSLSPNTYNLSPIITGGGQEFGLRSGTENVASAVGFAKAVALTDERRERERERMTDLGRFFFGELKNKYPKVEINGVEAGERGVKALPNIYNLYFPNKKSEELLIKLDLAGIAVSAGSACSARSAEGSKVVEKLRHSGGRPSSSLRFSFGKNTTKDEIKKALLIIEKILT